MTHGRGHGDRLKTKRLQLLCELLLPQHCHLFVGTQPYPSPLMRLKLTEPKFATSLEKWDDCREIGHDGWQKGGTRKGITYPIQKANVLINSLHTIMEDKQSLGCTTSPQPSSFYRAGSIHPALFVFHILHYVSLSTSSANKRSRGRDRAKGKRMWNVQGRSVLSLLWFPALNSRSLLKINFPAELREEKVGQNQPSDI